MDSEDMNSDDMISAWWLWMISITSSFRTKSTKWNPCTINKHNSINTNANTHTCSIRTITYICVNIITSWSKIFVDHLKIETMLLLSKHRCYYFFVILIHNISFFPSIDRWKDTFPFISDNSRRLYIIYKCHQ